MGCEPNKSRTKTRKPHDTCYLPVLHDTVQMQLQTVSVAVAQEPVIRQSNTLARALQPVSHSSLI